MRFSFHFQRSLALSGVKGPCAHPCSATGQATSYFSFLSEKWIIMVPPSKAS